MEVNFGALDGWCMCDLSRSCCACCLLSVSGIMASGTLEMDHVEHLVCCVLCADNLDEGHWLGVKVHHLP